MRQPIVVLCPAIRDLQAVQTRLEAAGYLVVIAEQRDVAFYMDDPNATADDGRPLVSQMNTNYSADTPLHTRAGIEAGR